MLPAAAVVDCRIGLPFINYPMALTAIGSQILIEFVITESSEDLEEINVI